MAVSTDHKFLHNHFLICVHNLLSHLSWQLFGFIHAEGFYMCVTSYLYTWETGNGLDNSGVPEGK